MQQQTDPTAPMTEGQKMAGKVLLLDANSLLYRAYFALPPLTTAKGEMTNAVYGFANMLYKILEDEKPDFIAAAFDLPTPTFRHQQFAAYKATRERAPEELRSQIPLVRELLEGMRIPIFEAEGFEADDLLGALARRAEEKGHEALIVSGDLDVLQVVSERVSALITHRGITQTARYNRNAVEARYGLSPSQLADLKALRGDATDNIPGVPGIGEKTAISLLQRFGSLEGVLANLHQLKSGRGGLAASLGAHAEQAKMSKHLATIAATIPLQLEWEKCRLRPPDAARLRQLFQRLEFRGLLKKLPAEAANNQQTLADNPVRIIQNPVEAANLARQMARAGPIAIAVIAEEGSPHEAKALGFMLAPDNHEPFCVPAQKELLSAFAPLLQDKALPKWGHGLKEAIIHLRRLGLELAGLAFDTEIASYLSNPLRKNHDLWEAAFDLLGAPLPEAREVPSTAALSEAAERAALKVRRIRDLQPLLARSLSEQGLEGLFDEVEMPLIAVLADMEMAGVSIDVPYLEGLSTRLESEIAKAEKEIFLLAGEEFNINSPKQLQHILYEKLGLPRGKKTKTGYSTAAATLAGLAEEFEIIARLLEYRELTKLKSTYVEALPRLVNPRSGRIHPSFNQAVAATGRLSCSEPNLQNIPIRTELGREIRRAFIAGRSEDRLLAADYSQIELRVLAHISGDEALSDIFATGRDLHSATAGELFGVSPQQVSAEMRRLAKIVNFSIPYGTTPEGLAQRIRVPVEEARAYMARYFQRFPGVARYIEETISQARESGYVSTLLGRRRPLPEISSSNASRRELAERVAINTPIQGSAADLMKLAMLKVAEALKREKLRTRIILQVHDELVFEGEREEIPKAAALAKEKMEKAYRLRVPLKVEMEYGNNWRDMEAL